MKKNSQSDQPRYHVTYIKLQPYLIPFMQKRHGNPMTFGGLTHYSILLVNHLVCNKYMRRVYTELSFSEYAYGIANGTKPAQLDMFARGCLPKKEDFGCIGAVLIPEDVIAMDDEGNSQDVETNEYYQFTRSGAVDFRRYAMDEFCNVISQYVSQASRQTSKDNPSVVSESSKDLLIKFMIDYDIPPEYTDYLYKHLSSIVTSHSIRGKAVN